MLMNRRVKLSWIFLLVGLACGVTATASVADQGNGPYQRIVERNVFALQAVVPRVAENPPPLIIPNITLTGITTILGRKIAFVTIAAAKPGQPPEFLMLAEGQSGGGFEVKEIDDQAGCVKVEGYGQGMALSFGQNNVISRN